MDEMREVQVIAAEVEEAEQPAVVPEGDPVLAALDKRVRDLEAAMGDLRSAGLQASAAVARPTAALGRKTLGALLPGLVLRDGVVQAGSLEDAMQGLSIEQRIAMKGEMMRKGLL